MTDAVYMDFEEPSDSKPRGGAGGKKGKKKTKAGKAIVPVLPKREALPTGDELRAGVSNRARSAVNLKLAGASYMEIADTLEYETAQDAKREVERTLAATHTPDDWQTLRLVAAARAEQMWERSSKMAAADFLVDAETGEKIPNTEKGRWHALAATDLMNHAIITGAKAPTKVEISPDEERMDSIVSALVHRMGHEDIVDAEVIEFEAIPSDPEPDIEE